MPAGDDKIGDVTLGLECNLWTIQQGHDHGGMHVERQSCRRATLAQRLISQSVTQEADTGSTEGFRDAQFQKALLAQPIVVLAGMGIMTVMLVGSSADMR